MNRLELKLISGLLRKAISFLTVFNNTTGEMVPALVKRKEYATGGICRTPADSVWLRANTEPWA